MSTRCQIIVKGNDEAKIYKHSDGYPEGVLPVLTELLKQFAEERGNDPEYCTAQIIRAFARDDETHRTEMLKEAKKTNNESLTRIYNRPSMLSWGVSTYWHSDIEYLYYIDLVTKQLFVYEPTEDFWNEYDFQYLVLMQIVDIGKPVKPELKLV